MILTQLTGSFNSENYISWQNAEMIRYLYTLNITWPAVGLLVEQLSMQFFFTEFRRLRSSLLLLTRSLFCWFFSSSSDPKSLRLQRSARLPVKSTKASDTCPAQSFSYEPWSLKTNRLSEGIKPLNNAYIKQLLTWQRLFPTVLPKRPWRKGTVKSRVWN